MARRRNSGGWGPGTRTPSRGELRLSVGVRRTGGTHNFVNGESIENTDVVVWYGAHSTHDIAPEPPGTFGHFVGPELRLVNW